MKTASKPPQPPHVAPPQEACVLIIDDSPAIRHRVEEALKAAGLFQTFIHADDGFAGFAALLKQTVDVVLCDVVMPGSDGFAFLALKKQQPHLRDVPVIMLTGENDVRTKVRTLRDGGASDYLTKPFHDEELVARVQVHLHIKTLQDQLRRSNERLDAISRTDELTGLPNRRAFMETLRLEFLRARRNHLPLTYAMVDVDHFKRINDKLGHFNGDRVLQAVAQTLGDSVRVNDIVGRYGGEEFAIIMPHTDASGALPALERCRAQIEAATVVLEQQERGADAAAATQVTVSIGFATYPEIDADNIDALIRCADAALYEAKHAGRNCIKRAA